MRRRFLVCYDIRDASRLRQTFKTMKSFGDHLQYSVFRCDLSDAERIRMIDALRLVIDQSVDSVGIFDLGAVDHHHRVKRIAWLGPDPSPPNLGPTIV